MSSHPVRGALERAGHVLFRARNFVFPAVFGGLLLVLPPAPVGAGGWGAPATAPGIALLVSGQAIRVLTIGFVYIKRGGKDGRVFARGLVTGGVFAHCRNPMYVGNLMLVVGYLALAGNPWALAAGTAVFLFAYAAIIAAEESYLEGRFGDEYRAYCARVPRLHIRLRGLIATLRPLRFDWRKVVLKEHGTLYLTLMIGIGIFAWRCARTEGGEEFRRYLPGLATAAGVATAAYVAARLVKKSGVWRQVPARGAS